MALYYVSCLAVLCFSSRDPVTRKYLPSEGVKDGKVSSLVCFSLE